MRINCFTCAKDGGENEDACIEQPHPRDAACRLYAVADGQGGRAGAARAAQIACRTAIDAAAACSPRRLVQGGAWQRILRRADRAVADDPEAGFTTLVAGCVTATGVYGAASGDSAALLACGPHVETLTAEAVKNPPVGSGQARFAFFAAIPESPWTLLVMTDGVWKTIGWPPIARIAAQHEAGRSLIESLHQYVRRTNGLRLPDDFTLIVMQSDA